MAARHRDGLEAGFVPAGLQVRQQAVAARPGGGLVDRDAAARQRRAAAHRRRAPADDDRAVDRRALAREHRGGDHVRVRTPPHRAVRAASRPQAHTRSWLPRGGVAGGAFAVALRGGVLPSPVTRDRCAASGASAAAALAPSRVDDRDLGIDAHRHAPAAAKRAMLATRAAAALAEPGVEAPRRHHVALLAARGRW